MRNLMSIGKRPSFAGMNVSNAIVQFSAHAAQRCIYIALQLQAHGTAGVMDLHDGRHTIADDGQIVERIMILLVLR